MQRESIFTQFRVPKQSDQNSNCTRNDVCLFSNENTHEERKNASAQRVRQYCNLFCWMFAVCCILTSSNKRTYFRVFQGHERKQSKQEIIISFLQTRLPYISRKNMISLQMILRTQKTTTQKHPIENYITLAIVTRRDQRKHEFPQHDTLC